MVLKVSRSKSAQAFQTGLWVLLLLAQCAYLGVQYFRQKRLGARSSSFLLAGILTAVTFVFMISDAIGTAYAVKPSDATLQADIVLYNIAQGE